MKGIRPVPGYLLGAMGNGLLAARECAGLTQYQVPGISQAAISRWERGIRTPRVVDLVVLARAYGLEPAELLQMMLEA